MPKRSMNQQPTPIHRGRDDVSPLRQHYFELLSDPLAFMADVSSLVTVMDPRTHSLPGEPQLVTDLGGFLDVVIDDVGIETTALLSVLAQLAPPPYAARAAKAAAQRDDPVLPWVAGLAEARVTDAGRMQDVFGDAVNYVFEVRSPSVPVFCMLVHVDRRNGSAVVDAFFVDLTLGALRQRSLDEQLEQVVWLGVDQAAARGVIEAGIELSSMLLPPPETDSWPMSRAMAEWVMRMLPPAATHQTVPLGDADRHQLIEEFLASTPGRRVQSSDVGPHDSRMIAQMVVEFSVNAGTGDPLEWSPRAVADFLGWWSRHVAAAELEDALADVIDAWMLFAWQRQGLAERIVQDALADVQDVVDEFFADGVDGDDLGWGLDPGDFAWRAPRMEAMRDQLTLVVGSAAALEALTEEPLPDDELFDQAGVTEPVRDQVMEILALIDRGADAYDIASGEIRTAQRRLLSRAAREAREWFSPKSKATVSAHAICWLIGRANDLLGPEKVLLGTDLAKAVGASGTASQRAGRLQEMLGMPTDYSGRVFLGDPRLLIGEVRTQLIELRDLP